MEFMVDGGFESQLQFEVWRRACLRRAFKYIRRVARRRSLGYSVKLSTFESVYITLISPSGYKSRNSIRLSDHRHPTGDSNLDGCLYGNPIRNGVETLDFKEWGVALAQEVQWARRSL